MTSPAFQRFVLNLDPARDPRALTYDLAAFAALQGLERSHAAHLLLGLARAGDLRAIATLSQIPWPDAVPDLDDLAVASPRPAVRAAARRALAALRGDPSDVALLAADALSDSPLSIDAAYELSLRDDLRDDPDACAALLGALAADDPIVRMHAMEGLLRALDLEDLKVDQSPLDALAARLFNTLDCVRLPATLAMRHVLEAVLSGADPADLGLIYTPTPDPAPLQRFIHASDHAPGAILALGPDDRAWAEAILLGEISRRDRLAPQAAVEVRLQEAPQALREVLARDAAAHRPPDAFTDAARAALDAFDALAGGADAASATAAAPPADPDPSAP